MTSTDKEISELEVTCSSASFRCSGPVSSSQLTLDVRISWRHTSLVHRQAWSWLLRAEQDLQPGKSSPERPCRAANSAPPSQEKGPAAVCCDVNGSGGAREPAAIQPSDWIRSLDSTWTEQEPRLLLLLKEGGREEPGPQSCLPSTLQPTAASSSDGCSQADSPPAP